MICCPPLPTSPSPASVKVPFRRKYIKNIVKIIYYDLYAKMEIGTKMITSCSIRPVLQCIFTQSKNSKQIIKMMLKLIPKPSESLSKIHLKNDAGKHRKYNKRSDVGAQFGTGCVMSFCCGRFLRPVFRNLCGAHPLDRCGHFWDPI